LGIAAFRRSKTVANWRRKLSAPLQVRDGPTLRTLADARAWMLLAVPPDVQEYTAWQAAARKMLEAADGGDIDAATLQLELALFTTGKLKF
jgi:hypothetical protein